MTEDTYTFNLTTYTNHLRGERNKRRELKVQEYQLLLSLSKVQKEIRKQEEKIKELAVLPARLWEMQERINTEETL